MILLTSKQTSKLNLKEKGKIYKLKNEFWKKGIKSQKKWFHVNIKANDIHNLLFIGDRLIGYTCLRLRSLKNNKIINKYFYFDTLIITNKLKRKGYGSLLTKFDNKIIKLKKMPSFLVCDKKKIKFYKKNNWKILENKNFKVMDENYASKAGMVYNFTPKNKLLIWVNK